MRFGFSAVVLGLVVLVSAAGIHCDDKYGEGAICAYDKDCNGGLVCEFSRCHATCTVTSDCGSGSECWAVPGVTGGAPGVCAQTVESGCADDAGAGSPADCPESLVCGSDDLCHAPCSASAKCLAEQTCVPQSSTVSACFDVASPDGGTDTGSKDAGKD
jgi:hypothetical protein